MKVVAKRSLGDQPNVELGDSFIIEFGEGYEAIAVAARDGHVDVWSPSGARIRIEPRSANFVWVSATPAAER